MTWPKQIRRAPCGCEWETGTWFSCARHATPHTEHTPDDPAPGCPACEAAITQRLNPKEDATHA